MIDKKGNSNDIWKRDGALSISKGYSLFNEGNISVIGRNMVGYFHKNNANETHNWIGEIVYGFMKEKFTFKYKLNRNQLILNERLFRKIK